MTSFEQRQAHAHLFRVNANLSSPVPSSTCSRVPTECLHQSPALPRHLPPIYTAYIAVRNAHQGDMCSSMPATIWSQKRNCLEKLAQPSHHHPIPLPPMNRRHQPAVCSRMEHLDCCTALDIQHNREVAAKRFTNSSRQTRTCGRGVCLAPLNGKKEQHETSLRDNCFSAQRTPRYPGPLLPSSSSA